MDKNIPIPEPRKSVLKEYKIDLLEVGESVLVPVKERKRLQPAVSQQKTKHDKSYTVRKVDDNNMRVWRTK